MLRLLTSGVRLFSSAALLWIWIGISVCFHESAQAQSVVQLSEPPSPSANESFAGQDRLFEPIPVDDRFATNSAAFAETDIAGSHLNFNEFPRDFTKGLTIRNGPWGVKLGGYVKADLIHDYRAINSTDSFDPVTIPIGDPQRTNTRFHTRQTRLSMDTRWIADNGSPLRMMVEGDFFGDGDTMRLRHAYGEYDGWIIGQTWSTLAHRAALPNTLDVVGDVASVGRRQAQVRWTRSFSDERWKFSAAVEDSQVTVEDQVLAFGQPRRPSPDLVFRLRFMSDTAQYQIASVVRRLGFQSTGSSVQTFTGAGLNATGLVNVTDFDRLYGGILWGHGIGSYRDLPDLAPTAPGEGTALESIAWYFGFHHQWSPRWYSNATYSEGDANNTPLQSPASIRQVKYLATNLIWQPNPHTFTGVEYLWGLRGNLDLAEQDASRLMASFGFLLP